jgi:hypothetical protein
MTGIWGTELNRAMVNEESPRSMDQQLLEEIRFP